MSQNPPLLRVEGLSKNFGGVKAVSQIAFHLNKGELVGVIGPNGSGKTTLVNLITGFIKPSTGVIHFHGKELGKMPPYRRINMGMARTFQMVKPFYQLQAYKNLIIPLCSQRVKSMAHGQFGDRDAIALDLLEDVGFERDSHVATKPAGSLPQGYLKRLELAKALALRPDLMILDELFSGLSLAEVSTIIPIIEKLKKEGKGILMVEHRLKELFKIADRIIVLNYGEIIAQGVASEVMESEAVKSAYLGAEIEG